MKLVNNALVGYFGPAEGFTITAQYDVTTPILVTFNVPGDYVTTMHLEKVA